MTANEMIPAIGRLVMVRFEDLVRLYGAPAAEGRPAIAGRS